MYATKNEILEFVDNDGEAMVSFFARISKDFRVTRV